MAQLGEFLPALRGVNSTLFLPSVIKLGLLDDAGLSDDPEVQSAISELRFPVIKLDPAIMVMPAEQKAKVKKFSIILYPGTHFLIKYGTGVLVVLQQPGCI